MREDRPLRFGQPHAVDGDHVEADPEVVARTLTQPTRRQRPDLSLLGRGDSGGGATEPAGITTGLHFAEDHQVADSGNEVYIVEKNPTLGGVMPQLAKTYPTMDCPI